MNLVDNIMKAFLDVKFQEELQMNRIEIEQLLKSFIKELSQKKKILKISKEINSRIKSEESLREKLERKNYINKWGINFNSNSTKIQEKICENLPDLIGFRINCYFKEDEKSIFEELQNYLKNNDSVEIEEFPNNKQKNGHIIYKIACKYNHFAFEVQVKSLLNDVWGEVEHSTIYKSKIYDSRQNLKKDIVEGLYDILNGADKQLNKVYSFTINEKEIKNELFFKYSIDLLSSNDIKILNEDYTNFFELTKYIKDSERYIDEYIGKKLLREEYINKKIRDNNKLSLDINIYKEVFDEFKWKKFCAIVKVLYKFEDEDVLLQHLISKVRDKAYDPDDLEYLSEDEKRNIENEIFENTINILSYFKKK
jgi:relA/spoT family protein